MSRKGPSETKKTTITALARERKREGNNAPVGDKQYDRSSHTKYAGCVSTCYLGTSHFLEVDVPPSTGKCA